MKHLLLLPLLLLTACSSDPIPTANPPHIQMFGKMIDTVSINSIYHDETAEADGCHEVKITGTVNTSVPGTYYIDYDYTDPAGNQAATVTRTVHVVVSNEDSVAIQAALNLYNNLGIAKHWRSATQPTKEIVLTLNSEAVFYVEYVETGAKHSYKVNTVNNFKDSLVITTNKLISDSVCVWTFKPNSPNKGTWSRLLPQTNSRRLLGAFSKF